MITKQLRTEIQSIKAKLRSLFLYRAFSRSVAMLYIAVRISSQEARVALGYRLEQLLRFSRALQTSRVHP